MCVRASHLSLPTQCLELWCIFHALLALAACRASAAIKHSYCRSAFTYQETLLCQIYLDEHLSLSVPLSLCMFHVLFWLFRDTPPPFFLFKSSFVKSLFVFPFMFIIQSFSDCLNEKRRLSKEQPWCSSVAVDGLKPRGSSTSYTIQTSVATLQPWPCGVLAALSTASAH